MFRQHEIAVTEKDPVRRIEKLADVHAAAIQNIDHASGKSKGALRRGVIKTAIATAATVLCLYVLAPLVMRRFGNEKMKNRTEKTRGAGKDKAALTVFVTLGTLIGLVAQNARRQTKSEDACFLKAAAANDIRKTIDSNTDAFLDGALREKLGSRAPLLRDFFEGSAIERKEFMNAARSGTLTSNARSVQTRRKISIKTRRHSGNRK